MKACAISYDRAALISVYHALIISNSMDDSGGDIGSSDISITAFASVGAVAIAVVETVVVAVVVVVEMGCSIRSIFGCSVGQIFG